MDFDLDPSRCRATSRKGRQCMQPPIPGGTVCHYHGGAAPQVKRVAAERLAAEKVKAEVARALGGSLDTDPGEALMSLVREAAFNVAYLRELVGDLHGRRSDDGPGDSAGIYGPTFHASGRPTGEGKRHIVVQMYDDERERLAKFTRLALDAGIAERQLRMQEYGANVIAQAIVATLDDPKLGLTREQREIGRQVAGQNLRFLSQQNRPPILTATRGDGGG